MRITHKVIATGLLAVCTSTLMAQVSYDVTVSEKKRIVSGSADFQKSDDIVFANALLWTVNEGTGKKDNVIDCDFVKHKLTATYKLEKDGSPAYICRMTMSVDQGRLMFLISDIKIQGNLLSAFMSFDKLNPEKKPKHQDIINEFKSLNNQKLQNMFDFISNNTPIITNWKGVCQGRLEKGMSADEVQMIYGKPVTKQQNGVDEQYIYSTFIYIFLENGIVKSFVN